MANCGPIPAQPELLTSPQITVSELTELEAPFEAYLSGVEFYQACIQSEANAIDVEIDNYEAIYQDWMRLRESAEEQKNLAIERFNSHVKTAQPDPVNSENESQL